MKSIEYRDTMPKRDLDTKLSIKGFGGDQGDYYLALLATFLFNKI